MSDCAALLRQLAEVSAEVLWVYEPHGHRFVFVSPAYERRWLRSPQALYADPAAWLEPVHADDRELLREAFDGLAAGQGYALEYRTRLPSGEERWIAESTLAIASPPAGPLRFAGVSRDITARRGEYLELLAAGRRKDEFLATLAHELRNPLAPIRSAAAVLARQHSGAAPVEREAVAVIERQVGHLTRLVDDLLDASRISHGKLRLVAEVVRLAAVIEAAADANRALVRASGAHLRVSLPVHDVWIAGDPVRLAQVFGNLLDNAAKFSRPGGIVELSVRPNEDGTQVAVTVRDAGAGIAAAQIGSIFDLFTQGEQTLASDRTGLGIGLSVVRRLTELHGGSVAVRSDGIAQGSEFVVTLPTTHAPPFPSAKALVAPRRAAPAQRRILLVDDNQDAALSLQALLELEGHRVTLAFTGRSALDDAARLDADAVILDIGLPDVSGYDVARSLRAERGLPAPLLIALTGYGREQDVRRVREAGFDHHLVKPADPQLLLEILAA
jgi:signal transduction histidine kinase/CheY-like chemotaxis protein